MPEFLKLAGKYHILFNEKPLISFGIMLSAFKCLDHKVCTRWPLKVAARWVLALLLRFWLNSQYFIAKLA